MNTELKVKVETIIRTVVLFIALINSILTACGYNLIPVTDEQIAEIISLAVTIGASLWSWWKNNSFTKPAIKADQYLEMLKKDGGDGNEV